MHSVWHKLVLVSVTAVASVELAWSPDALSAGTASKPAAAAPAIRYFDLQSNAWVNLHHFLYVLARARTGKDARRPASSLALADTVGAGSLTHEQRERWDAAVAYYARTMADRDVVFDSSLAVINRELARATSTHSLQGSELDRDLISVLERAMPVYRVLWWPRHDAANHRWIERVEPLLAAYGDSAVALETRAFRTAWPPTPFRVDVAAYTNWAGAYTTEHPSHINISSLDPGNQDVYAFEVLFHEVLHTMDARLLEALEHEARGRNKELPRDASHPFIFFTAGAVTRRFFPAHVPFAEHAGLWRIPDLAVWLPALRSQWIPYLDGRTTFEETIRAVMATI